MSNNVPENQCTWADSKGKTPNTTGEDDEVRTIQPRSLLSDDETSDAATIFEAFKEVSLDLTFSFSTQNSPVASTVELPTLELTSPPPTASEYLPSTSNSVETASSVHTLSRKMSLASQLTPLSPLMKSKTKFKSAKFSSDQSSSILRGSWPAIRYVGRGTPVDKNRRKEWSGLSFENVGEDGLLFSSDIRATSLDSRSPRLSSSSDWDFLSPGLPLSGSPRSGKRSVSAHGPVEEEEAEEEEDRVPPLQKIEIKLESEVEDWASVMETVLSSAKKENSPAAPLTAAEEPEEMKETENTEEVDVPSISPIPQEELEKLQSGLQLDVNIDKALDLGFTPAGDGGAFFTLAAITDSDNSNLTIRRTTTVSSRSQYSTPSEGPSDDRPLPASTSSPVTRTQEDRNMAARGFSDIRSMVDPRTTGTLSPSADGGSPWWKKALGRLKRVQALLRPHRNTC